MPRLTPEQALQAIRADFDYYRELYGRFDGSRERVFDYLRLLEPRLNQHLADVGLPETVHGNRGSTPLFQQWAKEAAAEAKPEQPAPEPEKPVEVDDTPEPGDDPEPTEK